VTTTPLLVCTIAVVIFFVVGVGVTFAEVSVPVVGVIEVSVSVSVPVALGVWLLAELGVAVLSLPPVVEVASVAEGPAVGEGEELSVLLNTGVPEVFASVDVVRGVAVVVELSARASSSSLVWVSILSASPIDCPRMTQRTRPTKAKQKKARAMSDHRCAYQSRENTRRRNTGTMRVGEVGPSLRLRERTNKEAI